MIVVQGTKRAFTTQGSLNTSLIIESCTLSIFPQQHNRIEFGVSSLANKLHLASKNLQNKHLITVGTGFGNTRAPKTHHTMRNSRRLARYKAHGFFLAPRRHWDALTKHAGRINYKTEWNGLGKQKNVLLLRIGLNNSLSDHFRPQIPVAFLTKQAQPLLYPNSSVEFGKKPHLPLFGPFDRFTRFIKQ